MNTTAYYLGQITAKQAKTALINPDDARNPKTYYATQDAVTAVSAAGHKLIAHEGTAIVAEIRGLATKEERLQAIAKLVSGSPVVMRYGGLNVVPEYPGLHADSSYVMMVDADDGMGHGVDDRALAAELASILGRKLEDWRELSIFEMAATVSGVVRVVGPDELEDSSHNEHEED